MSGIGLAGASKADAAKRLSSLEAPAPTATLGHAGRRFTITAADVKLRVDRRATAERAFRAGRGGPLRGVISNVIAIASGRTVQPLYTYDAKAMRRAVARIAAEVDVVSTTGGLTVDPVSLGVTARPPEAGIVVDRATLTRSIRRRFRGGDSVSARLPTVQAPTVPEKSAQRVAREAEAYLESDLKLAVGNRTLTVAARRVSEVLDIEAVKRDGRQSARLGVADEPLEVLVGTLAEPAGTPARDARISAPAAPLSVTEQLDLTFSPRKATIKVARARNGRELDLKGAAKAIAAAIRDGSHRARLPTRPVGPRVSTSDAKKVKRLIGTFTTPYDCCQPRVTNIRLMAEKVDGAVILPGEKFSLNQVAGRRTRRDGYVPAPFIADGKIVPSVGGGVSQFSTTAYNAAYFAGLQIDFHQPHSAYFARYPPGREATLDFDTIDLVWTNDTDAPVLVRTASTDTSVTVTLYGDNGGRRVRSTTGARTKLPGRDFSITVTRAIRFPDGRLEREPYTTSYDEPPEPPKPDEDVDEKPEKPE